MHTVCFVNRDVRNVDSESVQSFRIFRSRISHWEVQIFLHVY